MSKFIKLSVIDPNVCIDLVRYFNDSVKSTGTVAVPGVDNTVYNHTKNSTEVAIAPNNPILIPYLTELKKSIDQYIKEFSFCNYYGPFSITENIKIQHYKPGEGYLEYHTERGSCEHPNSSRHLVFMTYLNNVRVGGGTHFYHQNYELVPMRGITAIWPADWTHTHRGIVAPEEEKFIITGWYNFIK